MKNASHFYLVPGNLCLGTTFRGTKKAWFTFQYKHLYSTALYVSSPIAQPDDYLYASNFAKAFCNNTRLGLYNPAFEINHTFSLYNGSSQIKPEVIKLIDEVVFKKYPYKNIALKCFERSFELSAIINHEFHIQTVVTLGHVIINGKKSFYQDLSRYRELLQHHTAKHIELHAWITLPNYEIIDSTFFASYNLAAQHPEWEYKKSYFLKGTEQSIHSPISYQPVFVGPDFLLKAGIALTK